MMVTGMPRANTVQTPALLAAGVQQHVPDFGGPADHGYDSGGPSGGLNFSGGIGFGGLGGQPGNTSNGASQGFFGGLFG